MSTFIVVEGVNVMIEFGNSTVSFDIVIPTINSTGCVELLKAKLSKLDGVSSVEILLASKTATIIASHKNITKLKEVIDEAICSTGHQAKTDSFKRGGKNHDTNSNTNNIQHEKDETVYYFDTAITCDGCIGDLTTALSGLQIGGVLSGFELFKEQQKIAVKANKQLDPTVISQAVINGIEAIGRDAYLLDTSSDSDDAEDDSLDDLSVSVEKKSVKKRKK